MIGRRATVSLSLLSAFLFCALAAQSAAAAAHTSENTTAFTCVPSGGKLEFKDEHCDKTAPVGTGSFGHELIPAGKTEIDVTNEKTANETKEVEPTTLKATILKVETHIVCQIVEGSGWIENVGVTTSHKVTGTLTIQDRDCVVNKPLNCKIKEPPVETVTFMGVDEMGPLKNTMGVEFEPDPETKSNTFSEITFEGEKCVFGGKTFKIEGTAIATPGPTGGGPSPSAKEAGATWKFEPGNEMQNLSIGGKPAELTSILTPEMNNGGNPIALTTPT